MRRLSIALVAAALAAALVPSPAAAQVVPHRIVVGFTDAATPAQRMLVRATLAATRATKVGDENVRVYDVPDASPFTIRLVGGMAGVQYAEPEFYVGPAKAPANSALDTQWYFANTGQTGGTAGDDIDAKRAWQLVGAGSRRVLVGWADSGVQPDHPGYRGINIWTNPRESGGATGADDDGNGCIDDTHGCDTVTGGKRPFDENGHGTATAGVAFAGWDGSPLAGLSPDATFIPAKVLDANARGTTAQLAAGLDFLGDQHADVVNVSITGPYSQAVHDAIADHPSTLFVAASGNAGADLEAGPTYPCADMAPNVVCVAASNDRDNLASFSNYGVNHVDVAAPGTAMPSLALGGGTAKFNGTSFAAPLATAVAALAFSAKPGASALEVKNALLTGSEALPQLRGKVATGARISAYGAVTKMLGVAAQPRTGAAPVAPAAGVGAPGAMTTLKPAIGMAPTMTTPQGRTVSLQPPAVRRTVSGPMPSAGTTIQAGATVAAVARRSGARKVVVTLTCQSAACTDAVQVSGGGATATRTLALGRGKATKLTLKVKAAKKVRSVALTVGTTKLRVKVR